MSASGDNASKPPQTGSENNEQQPIEKSNGSLQVHSINREEFLANVTVRKTFAGFSSESKRGAGSQNSQGSNQNSSPNQENDSSGSRSIENSSNQGDQLARLRLNISDLTQLDNPETSIFLRSGSTRNITFSDFRTLDSHVLQQRRFLSKMLRLEYALQKKKGLNLPNSNGLGRKPSLRKEVAESLENLERNETKTLTWKGTKSPVPVSGIENRSANGSGAEVPRSGEGNLEFYNLRPVSAREKIGQFIKRSQRGNKPSQSYYLHLLRLAIRDKSMDQAEEYCKALKVQTVKKKHFEELNMTFLMAMTEGLENCVKSFLDKGFPSNVNRPVISQLKKGTKRKYQPTFPSYFMMAIGLGLVKTVEIMVKKYSADVNQSWMGLKPLHIASYVNGVGSAPIVKVLMDNGADPSLYMALEQYTYLRQFRFTQFFPSGLKSPILDNVKGSGSASAFKFDDPRESNASSSSGARGSINGRTSPINNGSAPLKYFNPNSEKNRIILDTRFIENRVLYPIEVAAAVGNMEAVSFMVAGKLDPSKYIPKLSYGLLCQQDLNISIRLLKCGANPNQADDMNNTPLHFAAKVGNLELCAVLLHFSAEIDAVNNSRNTPLHEAIINGHRKLVKLLIQKGADVTISNWNDETAVQLALKNGYSSEEIVEYFEKKEFNDADLDAKTDIKELLQRVKSLQSESGKSGSSSSKGISIFSKSRRIFTIEKLGSPLTKVLRSASSLTGSSSQEFQGSGKDAASGNNLGKSPLRKHSKSSDMLSSELNAVSIGKSLNGSDGHYNSDPSIKDSQSSEDGGGKSTPDRSANSSPVSSADVEQSQSAIPASATKRNRTLSFGFLRKGTSGSGGSSSTVQNTSTSNTSATTSSTTPQSDASNTKEKKKPSGKFKVSKLSS